MKGTAKQRSDKQGPKSYPSIDVAIIGAGPGGLYSAKRLKDAGRIPGQDFLVFDAMNRTGGRVRTLPIDGLPFVAEIGAMRYLDKSQFIINGLVGLMGLETNLHQVHQSDYYLRGKHVRPTNAGFGQRISYKSEDQGKGRGTASNQSLFEVHKDYGDTGFLNVLAPGELVVYAIASALAKVTFTGSKKGGVIVTAMDWIQDIRTAVDGFKKQAEVFAGQLKQRNSAKPLTHQEMVGYNRVLAHWKKIKDTLSFEKMGHKAWDTIRSKGFYGDHFLYERCLFDILHNELGASSEAAILAKDALGYESIFSSANAAEHIPWFLIDFGTDTYKAVRGGMSQLIVGLEKHIDATKRHWLKSEHRLVNVGRGPKGQYRLEFICKGGTAVCMAKQVILCVGKGALDRIAFPYDWEVDTNLIPKGAWSRDLSEATRCVKPYPLMKAFLFYDKAWYWDGLSDELKSRLQGKHGSQTTPKTKGSKPEVRQPRVQVDEQGVLIAGKVLTDLLIRQIYFHGPASRGHWHVLQDGPATKSGKKTSIKGMVMAYGDSHQSIHWQSMARTSEREGGVFEAFEAAYKGPGLKAAIDEHGVAGPLKALLHDNVKQVLQPVLNEGADIRQPQAVFMQDWSKPPFYGGWHTWVVGYKPWEIRKRIQKPFPNEAIHLVGEVFSQDQGWIEGAFRTAERMLQEHFKLQPPQWLLESIPENSAWGSISDGRPTAVQKERSAILSKYLTW